MLNFARFERMIPGKILHLHAQVLIYSECLILKILKYAMQHVGPLNKGLKFGSAAKIMIRKCT